MAEDENGAATISPAEAKISQIIKDLSTEASFSAEAMRQFMELRDECSSQESTIRYLRRQNEEKDELATKQSRAIKSLEGAIEALETERESFRKRESELLDREDQRTKQEVELVYEKKRVEDHQNMVGLIFRNTELRTKVLGQELSLVPGEVEIKDQYGNIIQSHQGAYYIGTPAEKTTTESKE